MAQPGLMGLPLGASAAYEEFDHMTTQNDVNDFTEVTRGTVGALRESNDIFDDPTALRERLEEEGYLFFRKLHNPDKVIALRKDITDVLMRGGDEYRHSFLKQGTDPMDAIADISAQCTEGDLEYADTYNEVYKLPSFHAVSANNCPPALLTARLPSCTT
jgi:hypothetical protein